MVAVRILPPEPPSKLATTRWWHGTTLPDLLGVADADEDDLYEAMDWLLERQSTIEKKLADRHLEDKCLALYDLSSSYFEGTKCPLAAGLLGREGFHGDPADRIIAATALHHGVGLVTKDRLIRSFERLHTVW